MEAASSIAAIAEPIDLPELVSWDEICRRYPNEWVILIDEVERDFEVEAARVFAHSPDKHELREAGHEAMRLRGVVGQYFTGIVRYWKFKSHVRREV